MTMSIGTGGGNKDVTNLAVGTSGGNKTVLKGYIGTSGGNKLFFDSFSGVLSPPSISGIGDGVTPAVVTDEVTAVITGGVGPFTFAWAKLSAAQGGFTAPTSQTTAAVAAVTPGTGRGWSFQCTVTDTGTGTVIVLGPGTASFDNT